MFTRKASALAGLVLAMAIVGPTATLAAKGGTDRPFKFSATGTSVLNLSNGQGQIALTGNSTHAGLFQQTEQSQAIPTSEPGVVLFYSTWKSVAANGDELSGTCAGTGTTSDSVHFLVLLECTSTGGTGRFEGASAAFGVVANIARVSIDGETAYNEIEAVGAGTISY